MIIGFRHAKTTHIPDPFRRGLTIRPLKTQNMGLPQTLIISNWHNYLEP